MLPSCPLLGPPAIGALLGFLFWGGFPYQNRLQKKVQKRNKKTGTLMLTSLLEDLTWSLPDPL